MFQNISGEFQWGWPDTHIWKCVRHILISITKKGLVFHYSRAVVLSSHEESSVPMD